MRGLVRRLSGLVCVMRGLVPHIHVCAAIQTVKTWMTGTSPAMTERCLRSKPDSRGLVPGSTV